MAVAFLRLHIDGLVVILVIDDCRQDEALRIRAGKPGVTIAAPLHWGAHAIAITQINIVTHADFVAVVNYRRTWHREQDFHLPIQLCGDYCPTAVPTVGGCRGLSASAFPARKRDTCSHALRRSQFPASTRHDCAETTPTGRSHRSEVSEPRYRQSESGLRCAPQYKFAASTGNGTPCGIRGHRPGRSQRLPAIGWPPPTTCGREIFAR